MNMIHSDSKQIFSSFQNKNILVIGDVMLDAYLFGKVDRISPEAPVPVVAVSRRDNRPGGAANVALNIKSLGAVPILCSVIGDDDKGKMFLSLLHNHKLSSEGIITEQGRVTTTKFRIIGNNTQMLRVDEETTADINSDTTHQLVKSIQAIISAQNIHCVVFQDYDKGVLTEELIEQVTGIAKMKHIPIVADPKKKNFMFYRNITLFKPNLKEFSEGFGDSLLHLELSSLAQKMNEFRTKQNIDNIMVTLSEKGVILCGDNSALHEGYLHVPARVRHIADVSGAGDTVISVAALCLAVGLNIETTVQLSNLAGGLVCQYVGVVPIDVEEFKTEAEILFSLK